MGDETPRPPTGTFWLAREGRQLAAMPCLTRGVYVMHKLAIAIFVAVSIGSAAQAQQQRSVREMMNDMKARYGQTYEQCLALASSRGYRLNEDVEDAGSRAVMMFVEGCVMGRQR